VPNSKSNDRPGVQKLVDSSTSDRINARKLVDSSSRREVQEVQLSSWIVFTGSNQPNEHWELPSPPSWRPRQANRRIAEEQDSTRQPILSATTLSGSRYKTDSHISRLVNAAIHLRRPLLISGGPGSGKSTLINCVAHELCLGEPLRWPITSKSTLKDGLYNYDAIGRFQRDEKTSSENSVGSYVELGPLGTSMLPCLRPRALLIDEIDKGDADLPNDLLNVLEDARFHMPELSRAAESTSTVRLFGGQHQVPVTSGQVLSYEFPFVVMTSNGEREFPAAFLRRCLQLRMPDPYADPERLEAIVRAHLGTTVATKAAAEISAFVERAKAGEVLATDQLLNAIQIVMGGYSLSSDDRNTLVKALISDLGRQ